MARGQLECSIAALHQRCNSLHDLKTDPLMDPLRQEPRIQAIMQELKFPAD